MTENIAREIVAWYRMNARDLPWRRTRDPYAIWISEVMLQQTQVRTVIPFWERWMRQFPDVFALARANPERVLKAWEGLGYYTRARNLQAAARLIVEKHRGVFPSDFAAVLALPGIGRYTAGAICSIAFGQATPILDGNVARVVARVFALSADPKSKPERFWTVAEALVKAAGAHGTCLELNQGLMELGATICVPREPRCAVCPLRLMCRAYARNRVSKFPRMAKRPKPKLRLFHAFIFRKGATVLVRRRPADVVNGGLWEFPNVEIEPGEDERFPLEGMAPFATIKHTITASRITLRGFSAAVNGESRALARQFAAVWERIDRLDELPFSSAHARLRALIQGPDGRKIRARQLERG